MKALSFLKSIWTRDSIKGNYYRKSLIVALIITSLPTAIIAVGTYFIGTNQIEKEVYHENQYQLQQVFQRLDEQFSHLETDINKGAANPLFDEHLRDIDFSNGFFVIHDIYESLAVLQSSNSMISHIDLYLKNQQLVVSNDSGVTWLNADKATKKAAYDTVLDSPDIISWRNSETFYPDDKTIFPLVLIHKLPFASTRPYAALLVYLNKAAIDTEMSQLTPYDNGVSFIISADGKWISEGKISNPNELAFKEFIKEKITNNKTLTESFKINWKGIDYSVAYATSSSTGWRYIVGMPLSQVMAPISFTSKLLFTIGVIGICIAAFLSWFASLRLYRPIQRLVQIFGSDNVNDKFNVEDLSDEIKFIENKWLNVTRESHLIQSLWEENQINMKKSFLLQLIQGHLYFFTEMELRERMLNYGWDSYHSTFTLMLIQLSSFSNQTFLEGDEQLVTFAAANIIEDISKDKPNIEVINLHNLTVSLLISFPQDAESDQIKSNVYCFAEEIIAVISKLTRVSVSVSISRQVNDLKGLSKALEDVKQCLYHRNIKEQGQILSVEDLIPYLQGVEYPYHLEKELIQTLQIGAEAAAIEKWKESLQLFEKTGNAHLIQQYLVQLLASIIRNMMQFGITHPATSQGVNLYEQLFKLMETEEIDYWFVNKVIRPFISALSQKQGIERKRTIRTVLDIIEQEYMKDISLDYLSDKVDMLPKRLSAVFAEVTGQNFIDYITELRLKKSMELLRNTDLKVNDIAARVGYQPSYFNKTFKKMYGITPGVYREQGDGAVMR